MAKINVSVPHQLSSEEALRRVKTMLTQAKAEHAGKISDVQESWAGNVGRFSLSAMGYTLSSTLSVSKGVAQVTGDVSGGLPFTSGIAKTKIETFLREQATALLA